MTELFVCYQIAIAKCVPEDGISTSDICSLERFY